MVFRINGRILTETELDQLGGDERNRAGAMRKWRKEQQAKDESSFPQCGTQTWHGKPPRKLKHRGGQIT